MFRLNLAIMLIICILLGFNRNNQILKTLVGEGKGAKFFLPAAEFHGHELYVLVKMCTVDRNVLKIF